MSTTPTTTVGQEFSVAGMTCGHCQMAVIAELTKLAGVIRVTVDLSSGTAVTESVEPLPLAAVAAAIDDAGYELV